MKNLNPNFQTLKQIDRKANIIRDKQHKGKLTSRERRQFQLMKSAAVVHILVSRMTSLKLNRILAKFKGYLPMTSMK